VTLSIGYEMLDLNIFVLLFYCYRFTISPFKSEYISSQQHPSCLYGAGSKELADYHEGSQKVIHYKGFLNRNTFSYYNV
jgi:hypothetical protein